MGQGPTKVITDLCILEPDADTHELVVTSLHPGVTEDAVREATAWPVRFARNVAATAPPTALELSALRDLQARTEAAHAIARHAS
jgi:glutaconate CoA-transferase subunit B